MSINGKYLFSMLVCVTFFTCKKDNNAKYLFHENAMIEENRDTLKRYLLRSAEDSVRDWVKDECKWTEQYKNESWRFDDWIFLNKKKDRAIFLLLIRDTYNRDGVQDNVIYFLGEIMKGKWFFFDGANLTLPRQYYSQNIHEPLPFEKLSEIARKEILNGYYYKPWPWSSNYEINEEYFESIGNYGTEQQKWDFITRKKRKKYNAF